MLSSAPTPRQQAYLDYIATYIAKYGWGPTHADMQRCFCVSAPSVNAMVLMLERRGFLRRIPGQARGISLIAAPSPTPAPDVSAQPASANKPLGWSAVRPVLESWDKPALLTLLKDLYAASDPASDLINTRCHPAESCAAILEKTRQKIIEQFFPKRGIEKLKLGEARQAIRDYRKVTQDTPGTAELLLTYVENGVRYTVEYGDIDERFYNSVESILDELAKLLRGPARLFYPEFRDRIARLEILTRDIGWGFHDFVADTVAQLENDLGR